MPFSPPGRHLDRSVGRRGRRRGPGRAGDAGRPEGPRRRGPVRLRGRLRQLATASLGYESARGRIPLGYCGSRGKGRFECFSAQARLLPYLELTGVAEMIDWTDPTLDFPGQPPRASDRNRPLLGQKVSVFLCPADWGAAGGALSYRVSAGWGVTSGGRDPMPGKLVQVADGLSGTALFGERLVGEPGDPARNPLLLDSDPTDLAVARAQAQLGPVPPAAAPGDPTPAPPGSAGPTGTPGTATCSRRIPDSGIVWRPAGSG